MQGTNRQTAKAKLAACFASCQEETSLGPVPDYRHARRPSLDAQRYKCIPWLCSCMVSKNGRLSFISLCLYCQLLHCGWGGHASRPRLQGAAPSWMGMQMAWRLAQTTDLPGLLQMRLCRCCRPHCAGTAASGKPASLMSPQSGEAVLVCSLADPRVLHVTLSAVCVPDITLSICGHIQLTRYSAAKRES